MLTSSAFYLNSRIQKIRKIKRIRSPKAIIAHNPVKIDRERNQEARILMINNREVLEGMKQKRSREMIMQNILEVCAHGASKTKIVYQSNLNFTTVNSYMAQLLDNDLLVIKPGESTYQTTKKGAQFMEMLKQHHDEISKISLLLART